MQTSPLDPFWVPPSEHFQNAVEISNAVDLLHEVSEMLDKAITVMHWVVPRLNLRPLIQSMQWTLGRMRSDVVLLRELDRLLKITDEVSAVFPKGYHMSGEVWPNLDNPILSPRQILLLHKALHDFPHLPRVRYRDVLKTTDRQPQHIEQYYRNYDKTLEQVFREIELSLNPGMEQICPHCEAGPHQWCVTPSGMRARSIHKKRLVEVQKPRTITTEEVERMLAEEYGDLPLSSLMDGTFRDLPHAEREGDDTQEGDSGAS